MQLPDAIDRVRQSVVQIATTLIGEQQEPQPLGSGFLVGDRAHVLTAAHVVRGQDPDLDEIVIGVVGPDVDEPHIRVRGAFAWIAAEVVARDDAKDLALLRLERAPQSVRYIDHGTGRRHETRQRPVTLAKVTPRVGVSIAGSGFPLEQPSLVTTTGVLASNLAEVGGRNYLLGDITFNPGNSGGPVYEIKTGHVFGMLAAGLTTRVTAPTVSNLEFRTLAGLGLIIPSDVLRAFMSKHGVDPEDGHQGIDKSTPATTVTFGPYTVDS